MWNPFIRMAGLICVLGIWLAAVGCADRSPADHDLIINEVMAVNRHTLADRDGEYSAWIEIFNPNSSAVNLDGWYLTDDARVLNKWRVPAAKVKANGYLVVFASKKDRRAAGSELHANFELDAGGGFLALVKPDGATISSQFARGYPLQVPDVSYGVDPSVDRPATVTTSTNGSRSGLSVPFDHLRYFAVPTPGARNKPGLACLGPLPRISQPGGIYSKAISVELSTTSPHGAIRYTVDGSEPTAASAVYNGPIEIAAPALLKARVFEAGFAPGPVAAQNYTIADESIAAFSSNLPLVIINTFGQRIGRETKTPVTLRVVDAPNGKRASVSGAADFDGRARIHYRGYTSMRQPKRSFALKTTDAAGESLKVPLLGMPKESDWILYAPYVDKSLMRDVLAYELSNKMGRYAPRTRFVEMFVTRGNAKLSARDYMGVYVLEEKIKRGKHRVNVAAMGPEDNAEPNVTGGYIFKKDHPEKGRPGFVTSQGQQFFYVEPKADEITPTQRTWLTRHLNKFERALNSGNFKDPDRGYPAYIDPDSFIDNFWLVEMSKNIDGFRFSTFFQLDRGGKIRMEPIWDWNLSFGNAQGRGGANPRGWYHQTLDDQQYSWFPRLFEDPDFAQRRTDRWGQLRRGLFAPEYLLKRVDDLAAELQEAQERNYRRWPILGEHIHPNAYAFDSYEEEIGYLKKWIERRIAWIDGQFPPAPTVTRKGDTATLNARSGKIFYTLDGSDPRLSGGSVSPKAHVYNAALQINDSAKIMARVQLNNAWSAPVMSVRSSTNTR